MRKSPDVIYLSKPAFQLQPKGLGYGNLKCVALKAIRFEQSDREKAKKLPLRKIKQAVFADTSKYTGEKLRKIRANKGVGREPLLVSFPKFVERYSPLKRAA